MSDPKTTVDWLAFRTKSEPLAGLEALRGMYGQAGSWLSLKPCRGINGFEQGCAIEMGARNGENGLQLGRVDFGGQRMRGWCRWNITGQGCAWVRDWTAADAIESLPGAEIRRVDVALTTWEGEVSHETIEAAHGAGMFTCGGRPPDLQMILNSNPRAGRTCNIGQRKESPKFFRGYEKGFEMASKFGVDADSVTHIEGHPVEDIYRCEVELKAESQLIPWEVIERRDHYFGGAYPFLAQLLPDVECDILMRRPERAAQTDLAAALATVRQQAGRTLFTALHAYGGDYLAVFNKVVGREHNPALLAAGVLLVDHEESHG